MKKLTGLLLFAALWFCFSACQKEIDPALLTTTTTNTNTSTDFRVKTFTEAVTSGTSGNFSETYNLSYDSSGRILSIVDSIDPTSKFVYTYSTGNTYTMDLFNAGALSIHETFFLNSLPLIDSTSQYNDTGDTTLEKSIYNTTGNLIEFKDYTYTTAGGPQLDDVTDYTYDSNGNIAQETESGTVTSYEYLTDLNTLNVGTIYEPKNKNLTKTTTTNDGTSTVTINHTYTFDSLNRITSEKQEYNTGDVIINSYTYF